MVDWALATTPANAEHLVCSDLERFKYQHWFFKRRVTRVVRGRVVIGMPPAFPRYIMVPIGSCWDVLHDVWRVLGIVCFGDEVARVREREVDRLIERCGGGDVLPAEEIPEPYSAGECVHVGGYGLASGHDAVYFGPGEEGKLRLMFDMMGRMVPIDVDQRDVFSVSTAPSKKKRRRRNGRGRHRSNLELRT